jgi:site-specific DNA-methyltransferase (adenine-specific)
MINKVHYGNSIDIMKGLADNSVDLTVTSPPYDGMRSYLGKINEMVFDDHFSFPFVDMAKELFRVTKKGGIVVWIVNDQVVKGGESGNSFRQALKFQELGFKIYDTMIYHKNGAPFPEAGRYSQVFEYMFVLLKGDKPNTVNILKDKENRWAGSSPYGKRTMRGKEGELKEAGSSFVVGEFGSRYNVWYVNNGAGFSAKDKFAHEHPAIFPEGLAEDHILSWSNEGDVVLDPMCGSGTTLKMAKINNRNFIGIDINQQYVDISEKRIALAKPYTDVVPNAKNKFIVSREETLSKRKKKVDKQ